uniref:Uncharacterized protein n=1 Tax=Hemiselmis tepida TaxID=464990 RepID=A0A7S0VKT5_9CRYP|mmetsp:Transcript_18894/g.47678  ORF Transcript_18894/g.47678 Transcript_18894/m.47678 type:complete len:204 (+) Transcript_18894:219-830(+)
MAAAAAAQSAASANAAPSLLLRSKVLVIGDAGVGKSAIVQMFHSKGTHYPKSYVMTTGCDFVMKELKVPDTTTTVELHIYDCSGQTTFTELTHQYWGGVNLVMLVYDATNEESFEHLSGWLEALRRKMPERQIPGVVVANKIDRGERVRVHTGKATEFARDNGLDYFQVSALTNSNIEEPFLHLSSIFNRMYEEKLNLIQDMM